MNIKPGDLDQWTKAVLVMDEVVPYCAPLVHRLVPIPTRGMGTSICVDASGRVYFAPEYADTVGLPTFVADVLHESQHIIGADFARAQALGVTTPEERREWNVAADLAINGGVFAVAARHRNAVRPGGRTFRTDDDLDAIRASRWLSPLLMGFPDGLLAEEYLDLLRAQRPPQPPPQPQPQPSKGDKGEPGEPGASQGAGDDGEGEGEGDEGAQDDGATDCDDQPGQAGQAGGAAPQAGAGQAQPRDGAGAGAGLGACGSAATGDDEDEVTKAAQALAKAQHGDLPAGASPEEVDSLRQDVAEATVNYAQQHGRGSVPGQWLRVAEGVRRPPVVDWRKRLATLLRAGLSSARGASDFSMRRPRWREGIATPRLHAPEGRVAVIADTSGSMGSDDLRRVLDETGGLLRAGGVERLWWIPTDSQATRPMPIRDLRQAHLSGGGGTDMGAGLRAAATVRPGVHLTVVITDGDTDWPRTKPRGCGRVLIVLTRPSAYATPDWADGVCAAFNPSR